MDNEIIKLLFTVSGGLEDLAEEQIQSNFSAVLLNRTWYRRTTGSQLYLDLRRTKHDGSDVTSTIADAINKLDFVEYVYVLVNSFDIPVIEKEDIKARDVLSMIHQSTSNISNASIDICKNICDLVDQQQTSNVDLGLGGLPGLFLPTPDLKVYTKPPACANSSCMSFAVNTIYTRKDVSKPIVDTIIEFIQQNYQNYNVNEALWVDAGSGDGSLLDNLPHQRSIGVDTHPTSSKVHCIDFFHLTRDLLVEKFMYKDLFVITNPPFSVSSRGDYTPIINFINHSFDVIGAKFVAVICPGKFARERIWTSLGLTEKANLWARFLLPKDSFYEPVSGKIVHIHSFCLIFGSDQITQSRILDCTESMQTKSGCYITAKRNKGLYPDISSAELTATIVSGLRKTDMELQVERHARYMLNAKLLESSFELWWQINSMRPCTAMNSNCAKIPNHSLGWISLSVKPAVALAMSTLAIREHDENENGCVAVNLMSGEGTIELEISRAVNFPIYMIGGDIRIETNIRILNRIASLKANTTYRPVIDLIVWDAQNLPLRKGIADAIFGDLPIQGTTKKVHQQPIVGKIAGTPSDLSNGLKYSSILSESSRILRSKGRVALTSVDYRSLGGACKKMNWTSLNHGISINLGGLTGKLFLMERNSQCTKDLCLTVPIGSTDFSSWLLNLVIETFKDENIECLTRKTDRPITKVELLNSFCNPEVKYLRHCYRFTFHDEIRNTGAKQLEKEIRRVVGENLLKGMTL